MTRFAAGLVLAAIGSTVARAADFEVDCRLAEGDPRGSRAAGTLRVVAAPTVVVKSGETASVLVGSCITIGGRMVPVGREVQIGVIQTPDGAVQVRAALHIHATTGGAAPQVSTISEKVTAMVQNGGGTVRVEIAAGPNGRLWADLTIRPVK
jgi:hypothetical protein